MSKVIERKLTEDEFDQLLLEAPVTETRNLKEILGGQAYSYFEKRNLEITGILSGDRPIYFGALLKNSEGKNALWTVVNSRVKEQFSLFKISKRLVHKWAKRRGTIYATMEKINIKNIEWTKRLGFEVAEINNGLITFKLKEV